MEVSLLAVLSHLLPTTEAVPEPVAIRLTDYLQLEGGMVVALGAAGSALATYVRHKFLTVTTTVAGLETRLGAIEGALHELNETVKARAIPLPRPGGTE